MCDHIGRNYLFVHPTTHAIDEGAQEDWPSTYGSFGILRLPAGAIAEPESISRRFARNRHMKLGDQATFQSTSIFPRQWQSPGGAHCRQVYQRRGVEAVPRCNAVVDAHPVMAAEEGINQFDLLASKHLARSIVAQSQRTADGCCQCDPIVRQSMSAPKYSCVEGAIKGADDIRRTQWPIRKMEKVAE